MLMTYLKIIYLFFFSFSLFQTLHACLNNTKHFTINNNKVISDSLQEENAIIIENIITIELNDISVERRRDFFRNSGYDFFIVQNIVNNIKEAHQKKIVIQNPIAIHDALYILLPDGINKKITKLKGKIIKPDHSITILDSTDFVLNRKSPFYIFNSPDSIFYYSVLSVSAGDEIEFSYCIEYNAGSNFRRNIFLNELYPVLQSSLTILASQYHIVNYKLYNHYPTPEIYNNYSGIQVISKLTNLCSVSFQDNTNYYSHLPYFSFSASLFHSDFNQSRYQSWSEYLNLFEKYFFSDNYTYWNRKNYLYSYADRYIRRSKTKMNEEIFIKLYHNILNEITIKSLPEDQLNFHPGYYLYYKTVDANSFQLMIKKLLDYLNIEYYLVFARSKEYGPVDFDYIRPNEITNILIAFKDHEGKFRFIYPSISGMKYKIDEISPELKGTEALMLSKINDTIKIKKIKIPEYTATQNFIVKNIKVSVDSVLKNSTIKIKMNSSGDIACEQRNYLTELIKKNKGNGYDSVNTYQHTVHFDTIKIIYSEDKPPSNINTYFSGNQKIAFLPLDTGRYKFSCSNFLDYTIHTPLKIEKLFNFFIKYCYKEQCNINIQFERPVFIENSYEINKQFSCSFGKFEMLIEKTDEFNYILQTILSIDKSYLEKTELKELIEMYLFLKKAMQQDIILKY